MVRNISHKRPKSPLVTLLMFDIDDITSMLSKISIENINTICVPQ